LPTLGIRRLLTFHILIFSSETPKPNEQIDQSEKQELPMVVMFVNGSRRNEHSL
jgi:hypothetical protein